MADRITCLACGRKLRWHRWFRCPPCGKSFRANEAPEKRPGAVASCPDCGGYCERRRGDYGDGSFCGLNCGYKWARVVANDPALLQAIARIHRRRQREAEHGRE